MILWVTVFLRSQAVIFVQTRSIYWPECWGRESKAERLAITWMNLSTTLSVAISWTEFPSKIHNSFTTALKGELKSPSITSKIQLFSAWLATEWTLLPRTSECLQAWKWEIGYAFLEWGLTLMVAGATSMEWRALREWSGGQEKSPWRLDSLPFS